MRKITLLHPSRGRPDQALATSNQWFLKMAGLRDRIDYILAIDESDPERDRYLKIFGDDKVVVSPYGDVVSATNLAAAESDGDILIYLSDDFAAPKHWDQELLARIPESGPCLLKVDDCLQKFQVPVLTIPIMSRDLYQKLGYFWHPEYKSMFVDEDLYWTCKNNGWLLEAEELKFPHNHPANGKAPNDETYKRSAANWDQGKAVYARRKAEGFPL